jgi:hypothetical protein
MPEKTRGVSFMSEILVFGAGYGVPAGAAQERAVRAPAPVPALSSHRRAIRFTAGAARLNHRAA